MFFIIINLTIEQCVYFYFLHFILILNGCATIEVRKHQKKNCPKSQLALKHQLKKLQMKEEKKKKLKKKKKNNK